MCQATVYLDGQELMKDVILIEPVQGGVRLATFFEEPRIIPARVEKIDLLKHDVLLTSMKEATQKG